MNKRSIAIVVACAVWVAACTAQKQEATKVSDSNQKGSDLAAKIARFAPTELSADVSALSEGDRKALDKLIEAARYMDSIFFRQVWSGNEASKKTLEADTSPEGAERYHYFLINKGPWSRLDHDEPFVDGVPRDKPPQGGFYPDDITKDEF